MSSGIDRSIAALLQERPRPLRRASSTSDIRPRKLARCDSAESKPEAPTKLRELCRLATPEKLEKPAAAPPVDKMKSEDAGAELLAPVAASISTVLCRLFSALEVVVGFHAARGRCAVEVIRPGVEQQSNHDLNAERLALVLSMADDMLEVSWLGVGSSAQLELVQRSSDGKVRPPTPAELPERLQRFETALAAAINKDGTLPPAMLPPRPVHQVCNAHVQPQDASCLASAPQTTVQTTNDSTPAARFDALRLRTLARMRVNQDSAAWRQKLSELQKQIASHDDATRLHAIVVQLFARFPDGKIASASDAEVLQAVSSSSTAAMCKRSMDAATARAALSCLVSVADGCWFQTEAAKYSDGFFLQRLPGGSSADTLSALRIKVASLKKAHEQLEKEIAVRMTSVTIDIVPEQRADEKPRKAAAQATKVEPVLLAGRNAKNKSKAAAKTGAKAKSKKTSVWVG